MLLASKKHQNKGRYLVLLSSVVFFGCVSDTPFQSQKDGAPTYQIDISKIKNPTPREEPLSRYGNPASYVVAGQRYFLSEKQPGFKEKGIASWYGTKFQGRRTSSGEPYDLAAMTGAHKTLPLPSYVRVTNLNNDKEIIIKVNDRGPFHHERVLDLSYVAAKKLGFADKGTAPIEYEVLTSPRYNSNKKVYLQLGAYSNLQSAKALAQKLETTLSLNAILSPLHKANETITRVRLGPYENPDVAQALLAKLQHFDIGSPMIVVE